jgi:two-component system cell cycle sensor histidine kinase/response regulator CckA
VSIGEQYFRALFDLSLDGLLLSTIDGTILDANPTARELLGMTVEEICARGRAGLLVPGSEVDAAVKERQEKGKVAVEVSFIRKDGTTFRAEVSSVVLPGDSPVPRAFVVFRDISQRVRAEAAVRESEERYQRLLDTAHECAWQVDENFRYTYWSPKISQLLGYEPEELLGKTPFDLMAPGEADRVTEAFGRIKSTQAAFHDLESVGVHKDGHLVITETTGVPLFSENGGFHGYWGTSRDVTEHRHTEQELQQGHALLAKLAAQIPGAIYQYRLYPDGRACLPWTSEAIRDVFEVTPEEVREDATPILDRLHPEDRDRVIGLIMESARTVEKFHVEYRVILPNKGVRWHMSDSSPQRTDDGGALWHGITLDITERKEAEEALRESDERLRQSQKLEAIGRLAGGIAHDFNNLLTAIMGYGDFVLSDPEFKRTRWHSDVRQMMAAAERAAGLTQQILAFSRRQRLQLKMVSINDLVNELTPLLHRTLGEDVEFVTVLGSDLAMVEVDPHQFTQVLMNLAVNARDAMPDGGVLTIRTDNVCLDEEAAVKDPGIVPGEYVRLSVSDTGVGIEPGAIPLLYEPFYTTKSPGKGTGLGLPTVYGVVKQSRGTIMVKSTPGEGTTFEVLLPRAKPERVELMLAGEHDETGADPASPPQERVLLVEDEEAVRRLTERMLENSGYTVQSAANGPQALAILETPGSRIDLLVTDVVLPGGIDGGEIARRARLVRPHLAVLFVSGYTRNVVLGSGDTDENVHYLEKPFTARRLALKVREALDAASGLPRGEPST